MQPFSGNLTWGQRLGRAFRILACVAISWVIGSALLESQLPAVDPSRASSEYTEYAVKAAFLLNFLKFVEWPAGSQGGTKEPFAICILGDDPFGETLDRVVAGELIGSRNVVVKRLAKAGEPCQILFVSPSERAADILPQIGQGVLTVGESPEFLRDGGVIKFVVEDRRVRFDINRRAAERASLRISSRLFGIARLVVK